MRRSFPGHVLDSEASAVESTVMCLLNSKKSHLNNGEFIGEIDHQSETNFGNEREFF